MKLFKNIANSLRKRADFLYIKAQTCLCADDAGESYIGEAVKILIAVVVGALLLALIYALLSNTVFPSVETKIKELFNFKG